MFSTIQSAIIMTVLAISCVLCWFYRPSGIGQDEKKEDDPKEQKRQCMIGLTRKKEIFRSKPTSFLNKHPKDKEKGTTIATMLL